jgi:hypothetical protein
MQPFSAVQRKIDETEKIIGQLTVKNAPRDEIAQAVGEVLALRWVLEQD